MPKPRVALVIEDSLLLKSMRQWLGAGVEVVPIARGRHLAADLTGAKAALLVLEAVHPSEAGWLISWIHAQPRLAKMAVIMVVPFGPVPGPDRGRDAFLEKPIQRENFMKLVDKLLTASAGTPPPSALR